MKRNQYLELFLSTLKLSAFTFGGGYVIVPLMKKRFVDQLHWIDEEEIMDLISVSQSSPGPIAVNASLMIGYRVGGILGALVTLLGTIIPPFFTISIISIFYKQFRDNQYVSNIMLGMQAGVAAIICNVVIDMGKTVVKNNGVSSLLLMGLVFTAVYFLKINILWIILICGAIGFFSGAIRKKVKPKEDNV